MNPGFIKLAQSFGAKGYRVERPAELKMVLRTATDDSGPVVPSERVSEASPWPFLHPWSAGSLLLAVALTTALTSTGCALGGGWQRPGR
jgi:hypothetical protein